MGAVLVTLLTAQLAAGGAWAGARPRECAPLDGARSVNVWERAKAPELRRYCDLLASGAAKITASVGMAREVAALADEADALRPRQAAPRVLKARALAQLGRHDDARVLFTEAQALDARALDDPPALLAWARVLARTSRPADSLAAYRALMPRDSGLAAVDRGAACLEAGLLSMARGRDGVDDAIVFFRQASRDAQDSLQAVSVLALALALDRNGGRDEARSLLAAQGRGDPRPLLISQRDRVLFPAVAAEQHALVAIGLEAREPAAARKAWKSYLDEGGATGPWGDHARGREASSAKPPRVGGS